MKATLLFYHLVRSLKSELGAAVVRMSEVVGDLGDCTVVGIAVATIMVLLEYRKKAKINVSSKK